MKLHTFRLEGSKAFNRENKWLLKYMAKAIVDFLMCFTCVWNLVQVRLLQRSCFSVLGLSETLWGAIWGDCCVCCTQLSISPEGDWNYPLLSHGPPHVCQLLVILLFLLSNATGFDLANASDVLPPVVADPFGINWLAALSLLDRLLVHHRALCMLLSSWRHHDDHTHVGLK